MTNLDPVQYHPELASAPLVPTTDRTVVRLVVVLIGVIAVIATAGVVLLAHQEKGIPDALIALGSATIGALSSLLVKTSTAG